MGHDFPGLPITLNTFEYWSNGAITEELEYSVPLLQNPHQWQSSSAFKAGRREVPGSNYGRVCRLNCSEFSLFFSETLVNVGIGSLRKTRHRWHSPRRPRSHMWTIGLKTYNPSQPNPLRHRSYLHSQVLREYRQPATGLPKLSKTYSI